MTTTATATSASDIAVVRSGFEAFGKGDMDAFAAMFAPDATWNHRNPDRLGGVHAGREGIVDFIAIGPWPPFNLADAAIVMGVGLLFFSLVET